MNTLFIGALLAAYRDGSTTPARVIDDLLAQIDAAPERHVWISRLSRQQVMQYVDDLAGQSPNGLPLYGIPFAVKDNIDLAGLPTTAGCPEYAYLPERSASVVQRLIDAGAIPIGKTNLDQFATGLVGTRSPFGECRNSFDPSYISGGSSSGSAVAIATGQVSFSLGTDTAGSGRVPAAFNNIVGLKPSCGLVSTRGVVPACRSLDSVSIFALTSEDAERVLAVAEGFDVEDEYSRRITPSHVRSGATLRVAIPHKEQLSFFGDVGYEQCFVDARAKAQSLGWSCVEVDFVPFFDAARLLYEGPWVAERYAAIANFIDSRPDVLHPVTRRIIQGGKSPTAADAFRAQYRLMQLRRASEAIWCNADVLMTPTAGSVYTIAQVLADPVQLNSNLGYYTNFVNLLDLSAVAVPAGIRHDGLPFGVTLIGRCGSDRDLLRFGAKLHRASVARAGATEWPLPPLAESPGKVAAGFIPIVVCGAHMSGLPLNHQLQDRSAYFVRSARTAPSYKFYALPGGPPKRPGLIRVKNAGAPIEVEVWAVPEHQLGLFVAGIPAPLGIGKVELDDASWHSGFLCEAHAVEGATDITQLGSWRRYLGVA